MSLYNIPPESDTTCMVCSRILFFFFEKKLEAQLLFPLFLAESQLLVKFEYTGGSQAANGTAWGGVQFKMQSPPSSFF